MAHLIRELDGTRDLLPLAAAHPARYPGLFESVARGNARARYDVLCLRDGERLALERDGVVRNGAGQELGVDFLDALDARWRESRIEHEHDDLPPFRGGWLLYLGYELAAQLEPSLRLPRSPDDVLPTAFALRCPAAIVVDHERARTLLVAETGRDDLIECMLVDLEAASPWRERPLHIATIEEDAPQRFLDGVARVHEHLRAGDVFQVNLARMARAARKCCVPPTFTPRCAARIPRRSRACFSSARRP
jgi:anthranilate synthase component 1